MAEATEPRPIETKCSHTEGAYHNCSWVELRNSLIEKAEKIAHEQVGMIGPRGEGEERDAWKRRWSVAFCAAMDRLVAQARRGRHH